eukprot:3074280-Rhodomonas_salina.1
MARLDGQDTRREGEKIEIQSEGRRAAWECNVLLLRLEGEKRVRARERVRENDRRAVSYTHLRAHETEADL